jgi:dipeptidyl aminopeptidase/acylaminoacyl peptidase
MTISDDGTKIAFIGESTKRYSTFLDNEVHILNLNSGTISRLTNNSVDESNLQFSPNNKWLAFTIPDGEKIFMKSRKIYIISTDNGNIKKLLNNFDYEGSISFWSNDSKYIYFTTQVGVDYHLYKVSTDDDKIEKITNFGGFVLFNKDEDSNKFIITYSDPENPENYYYSELENFSEKSKWIKLTDSNPQVKNFLLGKYEIIKWKSSDGKIIEGFIIKPENFNENRKYPLIVQIHGGPASANINNFSASYSTYVHIYTANDYIVFQPNYRGSTGYGERFKMEIAGDYFRQAFDDIMSGVDYLINRGIVHPDSMGFMGWSAGGHWSNWTLVSTDRFKAISSGAGAVNWISLYAQTDVQNTREFYFKGTPYENWDHYIKVSPLKYIKNAKTPTLIHFGEDDQRIPRPQGEELYIALKKLGVPVEFIVYPNMPHGLTDMRYQMVKMQAEFAWFEKWIRGKKYWLDWQKLIDTLKKEEKD